MNGFIVEREELYRVIDTYHRDHFLRRLVANRDTYPPGLMYLSYLGHAVTTIEPYLSDQQRHALLFGKLAAGAPEDFSNTRLYSALSELTMLSSFARLGAIDYEARVRPGSRKDFECLAHFEGLEVEIEVKCPDLFPHQARRAERFQSDDRVVEEYATRIPGGASSGSILPKDNKVKDFLEDANEKFSSAGTRTERRYSLLCVSWSHLLNEPLGYCLGLAGLFTDRSFARDEADRPLTFENVDGVLVTDALGWHNDNFGRDEFVRNPFDLARLENYLIFNPRSSHRIPPLVPDVLNCAVVDEAWARRNLPDATIWLKWPFTAGSDEATPGPS